MTKIRSKFTKLNNAIFILALIYLCIMWFGFLIGGKSFLNLPGLNYFNNVLEVASSAMANGLHLPQDIAEFMKFIYKLILSNVLILSLVSFLTSYELKPLIDLFKFKKKSKPKK